MNNPISALLGEPLDAGLQVQPCGTEPRWNCAKCSISFPTARSYKRHVTKTAAHTSERPFRCSRCSKGFGREDMRVRHERKGQCRLQERDSTLQSVIPAKRSFNESDSDDEEHCKTVRKNENAGYRDFIFQDTELGNEFEQFDFDFGDTVLRRSRSISAWDIDAMDNLTNEFSHDDVPDGSQSLDIGVAVDLSSDIWQPETDTQEQLDTRDVLTVFDMDLDYPLDMPALSRGNSASSGSPTLDITPKDSVAATSASTIALRNDEPRVLPNMAGPWDALPAGKPSRKLNKAANRCTICKSHYEKDMAQLRIHLFQHLEDLQQPSHFCSECGIVFVHEDDLKYHLRSVETGDCGFPFKHVEECTGHHPPQYSEGVTFSDHDRFKLGMLLRSWEQSQLQLHQTSVHRVVDLSTLTGRLSRLSVNSAPLRQQSVVSRVYSLKSFKSEHHDTDPEVKFTEMEKGFADLNLKNAGILQRVKRRIKHVPLINDGLRNAAAEGDVGRVEFLLDQRGNVDAPSRNLTDPKDLTPLMLAAERGHDDVVSCLLEHQASTKACDSRGETALHKACANGHIEVARKLLSSKAKMSKRDKEKHTALHKSIINGHGSVTLLLLLQEDAATVLQAEGKALLHLAVQENSYLSAKELLRFGVDPNCLIDLTTVDFSVPEASEISRTSKYLGMTNAILRATTLKFNDMVKILLAAGAYATAAPELNGTSPLKVAITNDSAEIANMLLENLQDLSISWSKDFSSEWNNSDIFCTAASHGADKILEVLFKRATNADSLKKSTLQLVIREAARFEQVKAVGVALRFWQLLFPGHRDLARMLCVDTHQDVEELHGVLAGVTDSRLLFNKALDDESLEVLRVLLANKASECEKGNSNPQTALPMAACHFLAQTVNYLQAKDYKWNLLAGSEQPVPETVLKPATHFHGNFLNELIEFSIGNNDQDSTCGESPTPLHFAAAKGLVSIVHLLLLTGGSDTGINGLFHCETPLCAAARNGSLKIVKKLLSHGANPILYKSMYKNTTSRCGCKEDFLNGQVECPLREAVICDQDHVVEEIVANCAATSETLKEFDFFGALFIASAKGSVRICRTILASHWKISRDAATSLLEIVIKAGTQSAVIPSPYRNWGLSRLFVLLDISDALIQAGAVLDRRRAQHLRKTMGDQPEPPHLKHLIEAMEKARG